MKYTEKRKWAMHEWRQAYIAIVINAMQSGNTARSVSISSINEPTGAWYSIALVLCEAWLVVTWALNMSHWSIGGSRVDPVGVFYIDYQPS